MMDFVASIQTHMVATTAAAVFTYFVVSTAYSWYRLRKVPGPFLASLTYLWTLSVTTSGQDAWTYSELAKKYGHLIRVGPGLVITDNPDVLRRISGVRSTYVKDGFYSASFKHADYDTMFSMMSIPEHDKRKAQLAGSFGNIVALDMEPIVDDLINVLTQYLRDKCTKGSEANTLNFALVVNYFTMDVITRIAFGKELGFLRSDTDVHGLLAAVRGALVVVTVPLTIPWLRGIITSRWFVKIFGPKPTDKMGIGLVMGYGAHFHWC